MTNIQRYRAADLPDLMDRITKHSIGMDDYFTQFFNSPTQNSNYPPYNLIHINNHESRLEVALAGFKKMSLKSSRSLENYMWKASKKIRKQMESTSIKDWPQGLSIGSGQVTDDTEIRSVRFNDGLLVIELGKVVPEHHARKDYL